MKIRSITGTVLFAAGIVATGLLTPAAASAKTSLAIVTNVGDECVGGYKPDADPITVKLLRADGSTRATRVDDSTGDQWFVCFSVAVMGSKVKLSTLDGGNPVSRTVKIPVLTIVPNRATNVVKGQGPAGALLSIAYNACHPGECQKYSPVNATANGDGRYQKDLSRAPLSADIDGGDQLYLTYQNGHGDQFTRFELAPYMEVRSPNRVFVMCSPLRTTTVKLRDSGGSVRASTSFTTTPDCQGKRLTFRKNGKAVNIHVGDRITSDFAADATLTWPSMSVSGQLGTGALLGHCLKDADFVVWIRRGNDGTSYIGTTDGNGDLDVTVGDWTFQAGDTLDLICESIRGDHVRKIRTL